MKTTLLITTFLFVAGIASANAETRPAPQTPTAQQVRVVKVQESCWSKCMREHRNNSRLCGNKCN